jgi:hypothetical protein
MASSVRSSVKAKPTWSPITVRRPTPCWMLVEARLTMPSSSLSELVRACWK